MPNKYINKLEGQRVLVFGGTSGIGFGVVEAALEHGATVFISGSNMPKLERTRERLITEYPDLPKDRIKLRACDLSDVSNQEANIKGLFEDITDSGTNKLNHTAHTAGDSPAATPITEFTTDLWLKSCTVRVLTSMFIAKSAHQFMEVSADSSITLTSGLNTHKPQPSWSIIASSGGAIESFTKGAAVDLSPIRVNCVSPGAIKTELFAGAPPEALKMFADKTLVGRLGRPSDTAEGFSMCTLLHTNSKLTLCLVYCMKDGFLNGEIVATNGGSRLT